MSDSHDPDASATGGKGVQKHTAGAFDIRNFIGALLGLYGLILTLLGIFGDKAYDRTGDVNANLYAGIVLLVMSAFFIVWARIKPIVVPAHVEPVDDDPSRPAPKRRPTGH
jgi:high-affinity Fe2+/Pb2+ permease